MNPFTRLKIGVFRALPERMQARWLRRTAGRADPIAWDMPERALLYVEIPKVATRSIRVALGQWAVEGRSEGWEAARLGAARFARQMGIQELACRKRGAFRFAFVRDPLSRLVSCYKNKVAVPLGQELPGLASTRLVYRSYGITPEMPFDEFVKIVARVPDREAERHFRSQHCFLYADDVLAVDFLGKFESLQDDWALLQERYGFPELPHMNRAARSADLRLSYARSTATLVAERYGRDIDLFGYREVTETLLGSLSP